MQLQCMTDRRHNQYYANGRKSTLGAVGRLMMMTDAITMGFSVNSKRLGDNHTGPSFWFSNHWTETSVGVMMQRTIVDLISIFLDFEQQRIFRARRGMQQTPIQFAIMFGQILASSYKMWKMDQKNELLLSFAIYSVS